MGGCCCCSSGRPESNRAPVYFYCPRDLEEHEQLVSTIHDRSSVASTGVLVDTNLDISTPDTFQAPPLPLPYDRDSHTLAENNGTLEGSDILGSPIGTIKEYKNKTDCQNDIPQATEDEVEKPIASVTDEEDVCPICLEEYDLENPQTMTKCKHHFHLSCILEWMERSDTCAICDQIMIIDDIYGGEF